MCKSLYISIGYSIKVKKNDKDRNEGFRTLQEF